MKETAAGSQRAREHDSIMGTNDSSIVSKRSVERLYHPEPHFFRYFVKKPQRRSPLINRGYWLRMHLIEHVVNIFLDEPSEKKKVILNLGCGYDPHAFQWLAKHPLKCQNATFVDVDYPKLIAKKIDVISKTPQIHELLCNHTFAVDGLDWLLTSDHYMAIGCDLTDIYKLDQALAKVFDLQNYELLCIAEVSVTYMEVAAADALIRWASHFPNVCFCLLEQFLPYGTDHPFAQRMIQHFKNLQTPLRSISCYRDLSSQEHRFKSAGWLSTTARSLWDLWNDEKLIKPAQKCALNAVEPFDEWEDFALFASHYFLLIARQIANPTSSLGVLSDSFLRPPSDLSSASPVQDFPIGSSCWRLYVETLPTPGRERRFGALAPLSQNLVGHHGGIGAQSRLNSTHLYKSNIPGKLDVNLPPFDIEPRMCHTITSLNGGRCLLVGGRTSPDRALSDCWLYKDAQWKRVDDVPVPLYRHCAAAVSLDETDQGVLVYGGKTTNGKVINDWFLWHSTSGWVECLVSGIKIGSRFGATMAEFGFMQGILLGGMAEDDSIFPEVWKWCVRYTAQSSSIRITKHDDMLDLQGNFIAVICRFGASLVRSAAGLLLIGGISSHFVPQKHDIICLFQEAGDTNPRTLAPFKALAISQPTESKRPLLIGHSAGVIDDSVVIVGGGAVCFSFGAHWNKSIWTLRSGTQNPSRTWTFDRDQEPSLQAEPQDGRVVASVQPALLSAPHNGSVGPIIQYEIKTMGDFQKMTSISQPFVMEDLDIGPCRTEWNLEQLKAKIGADRSVVVHEATGEHMDFRKKNFNYVRMSLGNFIDQIDQGSMLYLRSLAVDQPTTRPAVFATDFPELATEFRLPPQLNQVEQNMHSSPLRISGPVIIWLHYDVMANVLCQIRGSKRIILYPPSDITYLDVAPGASSSSINVFSADATAKHSLLRHAHPQQAILNPGDVLYIPPLWLHTALPTEKFSISINIFFRSLTTGYSLGRDVYGNRDVQAYENGRREIEKVSKAFDSLPGEMARFYLERLAGELAQKAHVHGYRGK